MSTNSAPMKYNQPLFIGKPNSFDLGKKKTYHWSIVSKINILHCCWTNTYFFTIMLWFCHMLKNNLKKEFAWKMRQCNHTQPIAIHRIHQPDRIVVFASSMQDVVQRTLAKHRTQINGFWNTKVNDYIAKTKFIETKWFVEHSQRLASIASTNNCVIWQT